MIKTLSIHRPRFDKERNVRRLGNGVVLRLVTSYYLVPLHPYKARAAPGIVQVEVSVKPFSIWKEGLFRRYWSPMANGWRLVSPYCVGYDTDRRARYFTRPTYNQQAAVDRLQAERDSLPEVAFSALLMDASSLDSRALNAVSSERALFLARSADRLAESVGESAKGLRAYYAV